MNPLPSEAGWEAGRLLTDYSARGSVPTAVFDAAVAHYRTLSDAMRAPWGRHFDVVYDAASGQALDIFGPAAEDGLRPVFLFIHGGYWRSLEKRDSAMMAGMLAGQGIATVAVDYRLSPEAPLAEIVRQVRAAVAFLYHHGARYGLDPDRIHVGGSSAGGHLTGAVLAGGWHGDFGLPPDVVKSGLPISGLFDLGPIAATFPQEWLQLTPQDVERLSPARNLPRHGCPVICAIAAHEAPGFFRQNDAFHALWQAAGFPAQKLVVAGRNHFDVLEELTDPATPLSQALLGLILNPR